MPHANLAVMDSGQLALAGSANLDSRGLFLGYGGGRVPRRAACFAWRPGSTASISRTQAYVAKKPGLLRDFGEGILLWDGYQL